MHYIEVYFNQWSEFGVSLDSSSKECLENKTKNVDVHNSETLSFFHDNYPHPIHLDLCTSFMDAPTTPYFAQIKALQMHQAILVYFGVPLIKNLWYCMAKRLTFMWNLKELWEFFTVLKVHYH